MLLSICSLLSWTYPQRLIPLITPFFCLIWNTLSGNKALPFLSYLSDRSQSVVVNGPMSKQVRTAHKVAHSSVLGQFLFTHCTSSLALIIKQHNTEYHFYADDSRLQNSTEHDTLRTIFSEVSDCYVDIKNWASSNFLVNRPRPCLLELSRSFPH